MHSAPTALRLRLLCHIGAQAAVPGMKAAACAGVATALPAAAACSLTGWCMQHVQGGDSLSMGSSSARMRHSTMSIMQEPPKNSARATLATRYFPLDPRAATPAGDLGDDQQALASRPVMLPAGQGNQAEAALALT